MTIVERPMEKGVGKGGKDFQVLKQLREMLSPEPRDDIYLDGECQKCRPSLRLSKRRGKHGLYGREYIQGMRQQATS